MDAKYSPLPQEEGSSSAGLQTELPTAVRTDDIKLLEQVAARLAEGGEAGTVEELVNNQFGESKSSCLHLAAWAVALEWGIFYSASRRGAARLGGLSQLWAEISLYRVDPPAAIHRG